MLGVSTFRVTSVPLSCAAVAPFFPWFALLSGPPAPSCCDRGAARGFLLVLKTTGVWLVASFQKPHGGSRGLGFFIWNMGMILLLSVTTWGFN